MAAQLDHVAVETADFLGTVRFFTEVFDMEVARTRGEAPHRQLWFHQGIQVNETPALSAGWSTKGIRWPGPLPAAAAPWRESPAGF